MSYNRLLRVTQLDPSKKSLFVRLSVDKYIDQTVRLYLFGCLFRRASSHACGFSLLTPCSAAATAILDPAFYSVLKSAIDLPYVALTNTTDDANTNPTRQEIAQPTLVCLAFWNPSTFSAVFVFRTGLEIIVFV